MRLAKLHDTPLYIYSNVRKDSSSNSFRENVILKIALQIQCRCRCIQSIENNSGAGTNRYLGATVRANDYKLLVGNPFHEIKYKHILVIGLSFTAIFEPR